jgi:ABC-type Mn2+/Zn2+ transport system permease subunit
VVLANLAGVSLYAGALVAGVVTALLLGLPARARRIGEDAAVAILLTGFFAVGVAVVSRGRSFATDLTGFLFGSLLTVRADDLVLMTAIGGAAVVALTLFHKELVLRAFDRAAAEAVGLPVARLDLLLDLAVAVVIVTALRAVGTLLAVAFGPGSVPSGVQLLAPHAYGWEEKMLAERPEAMAKDFGPTTPVAVLPELTEETVEFTGKSQPIKTP